MEIVQTSNPIEPYQPGAHWTSILDYRVMFPLLTGSAKREQDLRRISTPGFLRNRSFVERTRAAMFEGTSPRVSSLWSAISYKIVMFLFKMCLEHWKNNGIVRPVRGTRLCKYSTSASTNASTSGLWFFIATTTPNQPSALESAHTKEAGVGRCFHSPRFRFRCLQDRVEVSSSPCCSGDFNYTAAISVNLPTYQSTELDLKMGFVIPPIDEETPPFVPGTLPPNHDGSTTFRG